MTPQPMTALCAAPAFNDIVVTQLNENCFQKFARHLLLLGYLGAL
jgi:hypothetical protein